MQELQAGETHVFVIFKKKHPEDQQMCTYSLLLMLQGSAVMALDWYEKDHALPIALVIFIGSGSENSTLL